MPDETVNTSAQEYYCRLTNAGAALEAAAHAEARPVVLTHVAVGDGNGEVPLPQATATALVHEVYRRQIDGRQRDEEDPNIAWLHIIIPADEGGFWIREFGIYAAPLEENGAPVLYAYGNHAPYYKQQSGQGQATTHELSIPIVMSGTAEVEISVKDAGYASQLAFEDLRETVEADRKRLWENDGEGPKVLGGVLPVATEDAPGMVQPDGVTTQVDEAGLISALGGNLLANSEAWITASGTFTAPVSACFDVLAIDGGNGGSVYLDNNNANGGRSGSYKHALVYFEQGQRVPLTIGAGGVALAYNTGVSTLPIAGGKTVVGDVDFSAYAAANFGAICIYRHVNSPALACGGGLGGAELPSHDGRWYGAGGAAYLPEGSGVPTAAQAEMSNGAPGAVRFRCTIRQRLLGLSPHPRCSWPGAPSPLPSTCTTRGPARARSGARRMPRRSSPKG